jgi:hypothetical protein
MRPVLATLSLLLSLLLCLDVNAAPKPPAGNVDGKIRQLLLSSPWCSFSYRGGVTRQERVTFRGDGTIVSQKQGEVYYSGDAGTYASQGNDGETGYWKVAGGKVYLSEDGDTWEPLAIQLTFNSNGSPILKADGKEFGRCR